MDDCFVARLKTAVPNLAVIETDQGQCIGALEPIVAEHVGDAQLLEQFCDWHNRSIEFYSNPKKWLPHSTGEWLTNSVVSSNSRLLFLVQNEWGARVGWCGLSKIGTEQAEVYDIVRGEPGGHALLLPYAEIAMLRLCFFGINLHLVVGAAHRQNAAARRMGRFVGFEECGFREGRAGEDDPPGTASQSNSTSCNAEVLLQITRDRFLQRHPKLSGLPPFRHASELVAGT